jgi:hypothetical protein
MRNWLRVYFSSVQPQKPRSSIKIYQKIEIFVTSQLLMSFNQFIQKKYSLLCTQLMNFYKI